MAHHLEISEGDKIQKYRLLMQQIESVVADEEDMIANMANAASMIHETFGFWWTGFYRVDKESNQLVLGPFQGPMACTRIPFGRGVCGSAWKEEKTLVVPDVDKFPGHIACSSASRSEIVVPLKKNGRIIAVLDIDSQFIDTFDDEDGYYLEKIVNLMCNKG